MGAGVDMAVSAAAGASAMSSSPEPAVALSMVGLSVERSARVSDGFMIVMDFSAQGLTHGCIFSCPGLISTLRRYNSSCTAGLARHLDHVLAGCCYLARTMGRAKDSRSSKHDAAAR